MAAADRKEDNDNDRPERHVRAVVIQVLNSTVSVAGNSITSRTHCVSCSDVLLLSNNPCPFYSWWLQPRRLDVDSCCSRPKDELFSRIEMRHVLEWRSDDLYHHHLEASLLECDVRLFFMQTWKPTKLMDFKRKKDLWIIAIMISSSSHEVAPHCCCPTGLERSSTAIRCHFLTTINGKDSLFNLITINALHRLIPITNPHTTNGTTTTPSQHKTLSELYTSRKRRNPLQTNATQQRRTKPLSGFRT